MILVYVITTPGTTEAVLTASDIERAAGMVPTVITNGVNNYRYNQKDAHAFEKKEMSPSDYEKRNLM